MDEETFRIVYCSRNALDGADGAAKLEQILYSARRNNSRENVTGALLYNDGIFAQTLEGSFEAVQRVFERIQGDERHTDIVILQAETVGQRLFGEWAMALATPDDPAGANAVLAAALNPQAPTGSSDVLMLLDLVVRRDPELIAAAA